MVSFLYRYLEDGNLWLIRFTYSFRSSVFSKSSNSLQYKYVVLNSMHKNEYEVLHAFDKDTNRLLPIPSDSKSMYYTQCNAYFIFCCYYIRRLLSI